MNRRDFIKRTAILAAAATTESLLPLAEGDYRALVRQLRSGALVENQTFVFYRGETIVLDDLVRVNIQNCRFIWRDIMPDVAIFARRCLAGISNRHFTCVPSSS